MVMFEASNIFSLEAKIFQCSWSILPSIFIFSFDQALIQCSTALNQSAEFALLEIATIS